ncbi:MAG: peptidylprolyl isomerase [Candidatus Neomarinimicrobiota bacterium]
MIKIHFILLVGLFFHACEKKVEPEILATIGTSCVTAKDFTDLYSNKLINTKIKDSQFERERTLDELVRTRLFAQAARSQNLSLDSAGKSRVLLSKELALREELYDQVIDQKNLVIQDSTARKHFRWSNTEISLKHIFHQEKDILDTIAPLIRNDLSLFDYYAKKLFKDKVLNNSGGHLGWVPYNTLDPNIEQVAFSMPVDAIMGPVRSSYGWHLLLKLDERKQMIISEEDYQNSKLDLMQLILKKQSQIRANDYVNGLMSNNVSIDDELVISTLQKIGTIVYEKAENNQSINPKTKERLTDFMVDLKLNSGRVLATFQRGSFSINDLLNHLRNSSPKTFLDNPIQAFYFALRDKILTIEAINLGLLDNKQVQRKIHSKEDQYLAREFLLSKSAKRDNAHFSEKEISTITNQLKLEHKVIIYDDNLDRLFQRNAIHN